MTNKLTTAQAAWKINRAVRQAGGAGMRLAFTPANDNTPTLQQECMIALARWKRIFNGEK